MICDIVTTKEILTRSLKRAEKLKETMDKTNEGELVDNSINVAKKALALLSERNFEALNTLVKEELVSDVTSILMTEKLGGEISAAVGIRPTKNSPRETFTFKSARYFFNKVHGDMMEIKVTSGVNNDNWGTYTFKKGYSRSQPTVESGKVMLAPKLGLITESTIDTLKGISVELNRAKNAKSSNDEISKLRALLKSSKSTNELLKNAENLDDSHFNYKLASRRKDYQHGSVSGMRNVLADLHAIGGKPISNAQYDYYDNLLGSMHEHFFKDMSLYINDNAEDSVGWVDLDKKHILINATSNTDSGMSNAEVYTHEIIHTMVAWALNSKSNKASELRARLDYLKAKAAKAITWQDLMKADDKLSVKGAKARYDYIFNSKNSDHEFVAYALTNPAFISLLEKVKIKDERKGGFFNSIKNFFSDLMNAVMGNYTFANRNSDILIEVHTLAAALAEINKKADIELEENANIFTQASEVVDRAESVLEGWIGVVADFFDKEEKVPVNRDMNHMQKIVFFAKFFTKAIYSPQYRHQAGRFFTGMGVSAQSSIREVARSILPGVHDHLTIGAEFLGLQKSNIDLARNNRVANVGQSIIDGFKKTLIPEEEEALTKILLEANAHSLFGQDKNLGKGYSTNLIGKLLSDYAYRSKVISTLKRRILKKEKGRGNWVIGQAEGLGLYMATGKGHKAQNSNSSNIVRGYLSNTRHSEDLELLAMVEELASLTAINNSSKVDGLVVSNLLKSEEDGVRNIVNLYGAFTEESKNTLFKGDASHIIEGYVKELFDDKIETAYAVMSKKSDMESKGFKLVSQFENNDVSGAEAIGFFVSDTYTRPERLSGAVALGNPNSRGMTLKEARYAQFGDSERHAHVWFEADKTKHDIAAIEINKKLSSGVPASEIEEGPIPILDSSGVAVDYRHMMTKDDKSRLLKQNRKVTDVLSKTIGSVVYKDARAVHNDKVADYIKNQVREVYDNPKSKDNLLEHTLVGPSHIDPEIRKLYHQLPKNLQKLAISREDKSLPVPNMLMDVYFGYSHLRATDIPGIKHLPNVIKRVINAVEQVFMDLVKIAKGNILLKMPSILVVNVVSNLLYAINTGSNPLTLAGDYVRSIKDVHRFMQKHKQFEASSVELLALKRSYTTTKFKTKEDADNYNDEVTRLKDLIKRLEKGMSNSPIKELFDLGLYQAVIEDVNMYQTGETNSVVEFVDNVSSKLPSIVKTPLQWLFLSKETSWYQTNQYILQMSDLVARDVMNRKQKAIEIKQSEGKADLPLEYRKMTNRMGNNKRRVVLSEEEKKVFFEMAKNSRQTNLLRFFVNYNLPNGRGEEYLNRIGLFMFTKYAKRIQRVIADVGTKHPIRSIGTLLAAGFALDLETIQDQSFLIKAGDDYGLFGLTGIHTPDEIFMTVVNPPLVNLFSSSLGVR